MQPLDMSRNTVVFFKFARWSNTNASVERILRERFPEKRLVVIDLWEALKRHHAALAWMVLLGLVKYRPPIHLGKGEYAFFLFTAFAQRYIHKLAADLARKATALDDVCFTFQTTMRFNANLPDIPHFVYTDTVETLKPINEKRGRRSALEADVISLERDIFAGTRHVFTLYKLVSRAIVQDYGFPESAVKTVYAGTNSPLADVQPSRSADRNVILFVATEWQRKGGDIMLAAFHRVLERYPEAQLWIVGAKPKRADVPKNCVFWGMQKKEHLGWFYGAATIFCLPCWRDFFSISLLEAMASGLPVVASRIGGVTEMVEEGRSGFLVPVADVETLAATLIVLLADARLRATVGRNAKSRIDMLYNWDRVGDRIERTIRSIAGQMFASPTVVDQEGRIDLESDLAPVQRLP
jgi:glycosyltransferase involved in cell wall biosynthesis